MKCPDCQIDPQRTYGKNICVYCPKCGRTTQNYTYLNKAMEAWNNGNTKTKAELKIIYDRKGKTILKIQNR